MRSTDSPPVPGAERRPTAAEFYATNRGGGLFSEGVSQHLAARIAVFADRAGLRPAVLTLTNLVVGLAASVAVVVLAGPVADGAVPAWPVGLAALLGWQVAYLFDCADGQLARGTGQASASGARVDILCDVASQIAMVTALGAVVVAQRPQTPTWLVAAFVGTWMVNLVTSVLAKGPEAASMVPSRSLPVRLVKLIRDPGALMLVAGAILLVAPEWTFWYVAVFAAVNGAFLAASIAFAARASLR